MLLDIGVAATKITDDDCEEPEDAFVPFEENFDDYLDDIMEEDIEDHNNNDTTVNFNADISKIEINQILNEMRMGSPIENDLFNDLLSDETSMTFQFGNGNLKDQTINPNDCFNNHFNVNVECKHQNDNSNLLEQLLYPESCSTPDVESNDGVQFQYDSSEQFICEPDLTLAYPEEPDLRASYYNNTLSFNLYDNNDPTNKQSIYEPFLNKPEVISEERTTFECSTNLPMTQEELQADIDKYVNSEQIYSYTPFFECDGIHETNNKQHFSDFPYNPESQSYVNEQNELFGCLDSANPMDESPTSYNVETEECQAYQPYQCNICSQYTYTPDEMNPQLNEHTNGNTTESDVSTTNNYGPTQQHNAAYWCNTCEFVTHSRSEIRSHMLREH